MLHREHLEGFSSAYGHGSSDVVPGLHLLELSLQLTNSVLSRLHLWLLSLCILNAILVSSLSGLNHMKMKS